MKKIFKPRIALLTLTIGLLSYIIRTMIIKFSLGEIYLHLSAGLFVIIIVYFSSVSLSITRHHWRNALFLLLGIIIFRVILYYGVYDEFFVYGIIGLLMGYLILILTYIKKVNR
jgi:hypothetical protein